MRQPVANGELAARSMVALSSGKTPVRSMTAFPKAYACSREKDSLRKQTLTHSLMT